MTKWTIAIGQQRHAFKTEAAAQAAVKALIDAGVWWLDLGKTEEK